MALSKTEEKFILHWGEMGTKWGINRTVAQIHALLYLAPDPLNAEYMTETLGVARSNVSNSLRELQGWGIVKIVHVLGDRRDHFETHTDVWDMFRTILDERKRREIDPTLSMLRELSESTKEKKGQDAYTNERVTEMLDFFETMDSWYVRISCLPQAALKKFFHLTDKVRKALGVST